MTTDYLCGLSDISIHAPPRGATFATVYAGTGQDFNSRPSARGDKNLRKILKKALFQFTPLREGRHASTRTVFVINSISIHAPPRGATVLGAGAGALVEIFQFTPLREGRQPPSHQFVVNGFKFQFTPLREGRPPPRGRHSHKT